MKEIFKRWKWAEYIEAALLICLGILTICFNSNENLYKAIGYMVGIYLALNAVLLIVASIVFNAPLLSGDFISGIILLVFSILLFVYPLTLVQALPLLIGVGLIGIGVILISRALKGFILIGSSTIQILQLVFGIIAAALGSVILSVYYSGSGNNVVSVLFVLLGVIVLIAGVVQLCFTLYVGHHAKKFSKFVDSQIVGDIEDELK